MVELLPTQFRSRIISKSYRRTETPTAFNLLAGALLVYFFLVIVPLFFWNRAETAWFFAGTYMHFLVAPALLFGLYYRNPNETYFTSFIKGLRAGVPLAAILAILQFMITGERPHGFMGNALVFATISMISGFAAMVVLKDDKRLDRNFALAAFIAGTMIVFLSNARGMMITWPFLAVLLILHLRQSHPNTAISFRAIALPAILTLALLGGMFTVSQQMRDVFQFRMVEPVQALLQGKAPEGAIQSRIIMLQSGWAVFTQNPLFGVGMANTVSEANKITEVEFGPEFKTNRTHLHNDYLNHLVGGGMVLLLLFISILLAPFWLSALLKTGAREAPDCARNYFVQIITIGFAFSAVTNLLFGHDLLQSYFLICIIFIALDAASGATKQRSNS